MFLPVAMVPGDMVALARLHPERDFVSHGIKRLAPLNLADGQIWRAVAEDVGPQLARAVETVVAHAAARQGLPRAARDARPVRVNPIVETRDAPSSAPPGMIEVKMSEIFQLAGIDLGDAPDCVGYVSERPANRQQARALLMNMSMTVPR